MILFLFASFSAQAQVAGTAGAGCGYSTVAAAVAGEPAYSTIYVAPDGGSAHVGPVVVVDKAITVKAGNALCDAPTATPVALSGGSANQVFDIESGGDLVLEHVSLTKGIAPPGIDNAGGLMRVRSGGRVEWTDGAVSLGSAAVGGCIAVEGEAVFTDLWAGAQCDATQNGGVIGLGGDQDGVGSVTLVDGDIRGSASSLGGAISSAVLPEYGRPSLTVRDTVIDQSTATQGGCVYLSNADATFENTEFRRCNATGGAGQGGALAALDNADVDVRGTSLFEQNDADTDGGAIHVDDATVELYNTTIIGTAPFPNTAARGGGIHLSGDALVRAFDDVRVVHNTSTGHGGGFAVFGGSMVYAANNVLIDRNEAGGDGGGIFASGAGSMVELAGEVNVGNATLANDPAGTLDCRDSQWSRVLGNTATNGGGIAVVAGATLDIGGSLRGFAPTLPIGFEESSPTSGVRLTCNEAALDGGGVFVSGAGTVSNLQRAVLNLNVAGDDGGAVAAWDGAIVSIVDSTFMENQANRRGGGLVAGDADTSVSIATAATVGDDGTCLEDDGASLGRDRYCTDFVANFAENGGALAVVQGANVSAVRVGLRNNDVTSRGQAFYVDSTGLGADRSFLGLFSSQSMKHLTESALVDGTGRLRVKLSTLADQGVIQVDSTQTQLVEESVLWETSGVGGGFSLGVGATVLGNRNVGVLAGITGSGLAVDPLYRATARTGFQLQTISPAIDYPTITAASFDIELNTRPGAAPPGGATVDAGAHEYAP